MIAGLFVRNGLKRKGRLSRNMAEYLNSSDTDSDGGAAKAGADPTPGEIQIAVQNAATLKAIGNEHFGKAEYEDALSKYTEAVNTLKAGGAPKDALILLNRSATYLALKRYVPALNDANNGQ